MATTHDPWFPALCSIASGLVAAHPDWDPSLVAEQADAIAQACADRCEARRKAACVDARPTVQMSGALPTGAEELVAFVHDRLASALGVTPTPGAS